MDEKKITIKEELQLIFEENFLGNPEFKKTKKNDNYLLILDSNVNITNLLRRITFNINQKILPNHSLFKTGKTINPSKRIKQYKEFNTIYVLCVSIDAKIISDFESYYNLYYIDHIDNLNLRVGSAGRKPKKKNQNTFFYVAV